jgi:hypothetical protein
MKKTDECSSIEFALNIDEKNGIKRVKSRKTTFTTQYTVHG